MNLVRTTLVKSLFILIALVSAGTWMSGYFFGTSAQKSFGDISKKDPDSLVGTYTGIVYNDVNTNGTREANGVSPNLQYEDGLGAITVTFYNSAGSVAGTTTTLSDGTFSLTPTASGPYRVEYTNLPAGYVTSSAGSTSVQFVADGGSTSLSFGIQMPEEYCQTSPSLATVRQDSFDSTGNASPSLVTFPYDAGALFNDTTPTAADYDAPAPATKLTINDIGNTWGIGYSRSTRRPYIAAMYKRHFGFGPGQDNILNNADDAGAIYVANPANNTIVNRFTVAGATVNSHNVNDYDTDNGQTGFDGTGKTSLGGLDLSDDDQNLYVMNLENKRLYRLNPTTGAVLASVAVPASLPSCPQPTGNTSLNVRPFAVEYYQGLVYVGLVCSGERNAANTAAGVQSDLRAYVYTANPTTLAFSASPVVQFQLNYPRENVHQINATTGTVSAAWHVWSPVFASISANYQIYPQPMLTGIAFDNGNLVLSLRDRFGDQAADGVLSDPASSTSRLQVMAGGDILRLCVSGTTWTLESGARCGGTGNGPVANGTGPGNGEYYFQDSYLDSGGGGHGELSTGAVVNLPRSRNVWATVYDPKPPRLDSAGWVQQGLRRFVGGTGTAMDGQALRAYHVSTDPTKGNSLGDVVLLCDPAPLQIGNRVWFDGDGDGVQDPNELVIANVPLQLWIDADSNGTYETMVGSTTSDANGNYIFGGPSNSNLTPGLSVLPSTRYQVRIPSTAFASGGPLAGRTPTRVDNDATTGGDSRDSDGSISGGNVVIGLTTGAYGQNNHTYDFGFTAPTAADVSLSGRVFTASGVSIARAIVKLTRLDGTSISTTTNSFGYYSFKGLPAGQTVIVSVAAKRYIFATPSIAVDLQDSYSDVHFVAN